MYVEKGTSRVVVVIPRFGIRLKFARVHLWTAILCAVHFARTGGRSPREWVRPWVAPIDDRAGVWYLLLNGVRNNWRERAFSARLNHSVLAKTHLTFGFVKVQSSVDPFPENARKTLWGCIFRISGSNTLSNLDEADEFGPAIFGSDNGQVRVTDYPHPALQDFIERHADELLSLPLPPT
jgi:hypothetical protein